MNEIGNNLKRIRLLKNLSLKEAGELLNMTAPGVEKYEKGKLIPNSEKIIEFANAYNVNIIELLKVYTPQKMKFNAFRKKQRLKGTKLELLKETIENEVSNYLEVLEINNIDKNNIELKRYKCDDLNDAEIIAERFRSDYKLSINQPISDLISVLENLGIIIIQIKNINNNFDDFDGLCEVVNNVPIIVLLEDQDGARQRFTIAHELGHLLLKINDKKSEEKLCNRFASSLLMPKESVINEFGKERNKISFYELCAFKKEYKVSISATLYRLKELNIIKEYQYKNYIIFLNKNNMKKEEPFPIEKETSYLLKKLVYKLEIDNVISLNKACELLGVTINEYNNANNNYGY